MPSVATVNDSASGVELERRRSLLRESPIIAAAANLKVLDAAIASPVHAIYLLTGTPLTLPEIVANIRGAGKLCLVNLDFQDGLARDKHAVEYLAHCGTDGVVSTKSEALRTVQGLGMLSILRSFAIDWAAVTLTQKSLAQFVPDAIEILPAVVAPKVLFSLSTVKPKMHVIGGGLISTVREIEQLFEAGIGSVTTSNAGLWVI